MFVRALWIPAPASGSAARLHVLPSDRRRVTKSLFTFYWKLLTTVNGLFIGKIWRLVQGMLSKRGQTVPIPYCYSIL